LPGFVNVGDATLQYFGQDMVGQGGVDLGVNGVAADKRALPVRAFQFAGEQIRPAFSFTRADPACPAEHLQDRGDIEFVEPDLRVTHDHGPGRQIATGGDRSGGRQNVPVTMTEPGFGLAFELPVL
jgi:hypothetical protein